MPFQKYINKDISISIDVSDVLDIDDREQTFTLLYWTQLEWEDSNLNFTFLKEKMSTNLLDNQSIQNIWTPELTFFTTVLKSSDIISEDIYVIQKAIPKLSGDNDVLRSNETYSGEENSLRKEILYQRKFVCNFFDKMRTYPFGKQICKVSIALKTSDQERVEKSPQKYYS